MSAAALGGEPTTPSSTRFSPITATDHAGYVWIVAILGITYTALTCALRGWIKFRVYGWDDVLIALATVLHLGQAVAVFVGLAHGLAQSHNAIITDPAADIPTAGKALFAAEMLGLVVLGLSKCSVLALMLRVFTPDTGMAAGYRACIVLTILSGLWCVASITAISANCGVADILTPESKERCPGMYDRMLGITIPDIITDVLICLVPVCVTMPLNMTAGVRFNVSLGFSFRLFVVPLSALRLLLLQQAASLVSATIPNLRIFMKSMNTGFNLPALATAETRGYALRTFGGSTMISGRSGGGGMDSTNNKSLASRSSRNRDQFQELSLRPDGIHHEARISHVAHQSDATSEEQDSLNRTGSQDRIITKRVEWAVRHDTG
ncbi:hypothetical protein PG994_000829 [Apiospora phragmitis]|uniref:Rhodopsin domain-containing protein n=1 Tax=Apiospora phragmitis TaxID=2905665 RepID=A0ABR1X7L2_9PEZI